MKVIIESASPYNNVYVKCQPMPDDASGDDIKRICIACSDLHSDAYPHMRTETTPDGWRVFVTSRTGQESHRFNVTID